MSSSQVRARPWGLDLATQALLGGAIGTGLSLTLDPDFTWTAASLVRSFLYGGLIAAGAVLISRFFDQVLSPLLARYPLWLEILAWALVLPCGVGALFLVGLVVLYGKTPDGGMLRALPIVLAYTLVLSFVSSFATRVMRLVGGRVLLDLLRGSYLRPQLERRVVLFIDMADSTALAERLGETRMQDMLARFFTAIDEPLAACGGEVHAYVGDGAVVTWQAQTPERNGRAAAALAAMQQRLVDDGPAFRALFGTEPQFRAGLHLGELAVAEIGGRRRQISLFGDTMNVAARLQDAAKTIEEPWVASAAYVESARLPAELKVRALGELTLRGRTAPMAAYALG